MTRLVSLGLVIFLLACPVFAQLDRATITGTVTDSTSAVIPGVKIVLTNTGTAATYRTETNHVGQYTVPNLPTGKYQATFEAGGFKMLTRSGIELRVTDVARVDVALQVGAVSDSVQVVAEVPRLQTDSPEVGTDLSNKQLVDLPLSFGGKRTAEDFAYKITPGVTGDNWRGHVNGSTDFSHETILDGASASTNRSGNFEGGPSVEALQELKVQTSGISAEFGRVQTGVFNYIMKSGTNEIHGSGYAEFRDAALNANSFVNNFYGRQRDKDSKQDIAGSFGGPVVLPKIYDGRNKTFFYFAYERFRQIQDGAGAPSVTAPLPEFYEGDFSRLLSGATGSKDALGRDVIKGAIYDPATFRQLADGTWVGDMFPGNRIPVARFSKTSQHINEIAKAHYLPNVKDASGLFPLQNNMLFPTSSEPQNNQHQLSIKLDQNISDRHKLAGSYSRGANPRLDLVSGLWDPNEFDGGPFSKTQWLNQRHHFYRVAEDWTVTPRLLNHITLSANRFINPVYSIHNGVNGAKELGIAGLDSESYPVINWGGGPVMSLASIGDSQNTLIAYNQFGLLDTISFSTGRHFMKAGIDIRRNQMNYHLSAQPGLSFSAGATSIPNATFSKWTGFAFASYELGIVNSASLSDARPTGDRKHYYAGFFQDDWKVSDRLTLNLGMRWDFQPPGFEVNNLLSSWSPNETDPVSGLKGAYQFAGNCPSCTGQNYFGTKDYKAFGPRFGFAYRASDKWTIRGGYGIFYEGDFFGGTSTTFLGKQTSLQASGTYSLQPDPLRSWEGLYNWDNPFPGAQRYTPPGFDKSWGDRNSPGMIDPNYGNMPYVQAWNLNIQRQLAKGLTLDVGYIANKGTRLKNGELNAMNQLHVEDVAKYKTDLSKTIASPADAAKYGIAYPYPGFKGTLAQALRPYPQVQGMSQIWTYGSPLGFSTYNSLQTTINKQFRHGLSVYANYVWSKSITNTSSSAANDNRGGPADYYNLALEKAVGGYDIPHMFKAYFDYELPIGRGKAVWNGAPKVANAIVGGWSVSGIVNYFSGTPLAFPAMTWLYGWNGNASRANVDAGPLTVPFDGAGFNFANIKSASNKYINTGAIHDASDFQMGTGAPRYTQARGFGTKNEDIGIYKNTRIGEKYRVQLRGELMNAFNRHTFGGIENRLWKTYFGQVTDVSGYRQIQLGARFDF